MSYTFSLPNITAKTADGKLQQMHSFLYQTIEQLNWALNTIESGTGSGDAVNQTAQKDGNTSPEEKAEASFNEIKALIIKSADIVNAYYEKINAKLVGEYVAISEFGTYKEDTEAQIEANSKAIEQRYGDIQEIITDIENLEHDMIEVNAHIKSGLLYYDEDGSPVYGLEIGQRTEADGEEVFNKYARFTSDKLSFYDRNDNEVAYISDKKLYITHIQVIVSFKQGGFVDTTLSDGSIVTKWEGGIS